MPTSAGASTGSDSSPEAAASDRARTPLTHPRRITGNGAAASAVPRLILGDQSVMRTVFGALAARPDPRTTNPKRPNSSQNAAYPQILSVHGVRGTPSARPTYPHGAR